MEFVISGSCQDFCDGAASVLNVRVVGKQAVKPKPVMLKSEYPSYLKKLKQKIQRLKPLKMTWIFTECVVLVWIFDQHFFITAWTCATD